MASNEQTAIGALIRDRTSFLGLTSKAIVQRCGFSNVTKGLRRLEQVYAGDFAQARFLLSKLPAALSLEPRIIEAAIDATRQDQQHQEEQRYRDAFRPHAIIICERSIPEPIWVAVVIGFDRLLRIDFADRSAPITYVKQALEGVRQKLARWNSSSLPAFGRPMGLVINYALVYAVEFSMEGEPLLVYDRAIKVGDANLRLTNKAISPRELSALFGVE